MSYVYKNLMAEERIIYQARLHWILFVRSIVIVVIGVTFMSIGDTGSNFGFILISIGLIISIPSFISYNTSEFAVTNKRLIVKVGFIKRDTLELLLTKVESNQVHQSIIERILGYGTIIISGTGGIKDPFHKISKPLKFRKHAQEQIAIVQGLR